MISDCRLGMGLQWDMAGTKRAIAIWRVILQTHYNKGSRNLLQINGIKNSFVLYQSKNFLNSSHQYFEYGGK